jgi:hypothetical protein
MKKIPSMTAILMIAILVGCNLPGGTSITGSPDAVFTQAAQTVAAELTRVSLLASPTPNVPTATATLIPTNSPIPTITLTPIPCNHASYDPSTIDVTIPDNTLMTPGQAFTKIWRIRNAGTCTWTSGYRVAFDHGDGLGMLAGYSQSLTGGVIPPGQTVDINVNLTAPMGNGTYRGDWAVKDQNGLTFMTFIVVIKVSASGVVTLVPVGAESGTTRSDAGPWPDFTAGESNADITRTCEAFLSYDITGIPANATITDVKFNFTNYTVTGNPFGLGVLNAYVANYGLTLEPVDFVAGIPSGQIADWWSTAALNVIESSPELKTTLQAKIGSGRLQLRLQFAGSNGDAIKDRITFTNPSLVVTYSTP